MKCPQCGKEFEPKTVVQKYCSKACAQKYCRTHDMDAEYPSITFQCATCGKTVVTEGGTRDKRTRFCCQSCEKKFWKKPPWDYLTGKTNWHSADEYLRWEQRTNE